MAEPAGIEEDERACRMSGKVTGSFNTVELSRTDGIGKASTRSASASPPKWHDSRGQRVRPAVAIKWQPLSASNVD
ncbi:hypothetical protein CXZ05_06865 [Arthrobacter sp. AFG20]|nr:hypothetical protein CXZ05_06865 [Arthrobacter sp. AFG20]